MPSVTSWTRVESRCRGEVSVGLQARVYDPLWMIGRQWQLGELLGEDAGSPVIARIRGTAYALERFRAGPPRNDGGGVAYRPQTAPLETMVEGEPRPASVLGARQRLAAGVELARALHAVGLARYVARFATAFPLDAPPDSATPPERRVISAAVGRVPDGAKLHDAVGPFVAPDTGAPHLPPAPVIDSPDRDAVLAALVAWAGWFAQFAPPVTSTPMSSWQPDRLEYRFAVSARVDGQEVVLEAPEYAGGRLDWDAFQIASGQTLGPVDAEPAALQILDTLLPSPVEYAGMPRPRWWELEDGRVDFGAIDAGPTDLGRLLAAEMALVWGNDWFIIPVDVPAGSLARVSSLVVADTFGVHTLVRPVRQGSDFRLFGLAGSTIDAGTAATGNAAADLLFVPPVTASTAESQPIEELLLARDELANVSWAIERVVEGPLGDPIRADERGPIPRPTPTSTAPAPRYTVATDVPPSWYPLIPVRDGARGARWLVRAAAFTGATPPPSPRGRILGTELDRLHEEELPREGLLLTRRTQFARWTGGATHLWVGRHKRPGHGEVLSRFVFDAVREV